MSNLPPPPPYESHSVRSLYRRHMGDASVSELFLPDHCRLGPWNWREFALAVELVLRAKGIPVAHLRRADCPLALHADGGWPPLLRREQEALWRADDEFCRAVILLNVRADHIAFDAGTHERFAAAAIWQTLERRHQEIWRQIERDKVLMCRVCWIALGVLVVLVCLSCFGGRTRVPSEPGWVF